METLTINILKRLNKYEKDSVQYKLIFNCYKLAMEKYFKKHPNLYVDTSAGFVLHDGDYLTDYELEIIRPFFIRWADRILFGSDANASWNEINCSSEHIIGRHVYNHVHPFKRFIQKLYLPQDVLSKVAHYNFERLFNMPPAEDWFF